MKASEIFDRVLSLMFLKEDIDGEYREPFLRILNMRLKELNVLNDAILEFNGQKGINQPEIKDMSDEILYEKPILNLLPYGIACILMVEEDVTGIANVYRNDYESMKADCSRCFYEEESESWR